MYLTFEPSILLLAALIALLIGVVELNCWRCRRRRVHMEAKALRRAAKRWERD